MARPPRRIQRQRTRGWRMPESTVYVGRPGPFGNPFPVNVYGPEGAVDRFRRWIEGRMSADEMSKSSRADDGYTSLVTLRSMMLARIGELRGKNLACWCAPGVPCHANVLIRVANGYVCEEVEP